HDDLRERTGRRERHLTLAQAHARGRRCDELPRHRLPRIPLHRGDVDHILDRAFALVVLGVFMVNAEDGFNEQAMPVSIHAWSLLFYAAVFLVWGVMRVESVALTRLLRSAGVVLLVVLAMLYRGGVDGHGAMRPQW